jgi:hypothetical protein
MLTGQGVGIKMDGQDKGFAFQSYFILSIHVDFSDSKRVAAPGRLARRMR